MISVQPLRCTGVLGENNCENSIYGDAVRIGRANQNIREMKKIIFYINCVAYYNLRIRYRFEPIKNEPENKLENILETKNWPSKQELSQYLFLICVVFFSEWDQMLITISAQLLTFGRTVKPRFTAQFGGIEKRTVNRDDR